MKPFRMAMIGLAAGAVPVVIAIGVMASSGSQHSARSSQQLGTTTGKNLNPADPGGNGLGNSHNGSGTIGSAPAPAGSQHIGSGTAPAGSQGFGSAPGGSGTVGGAPGPTGTVRSAPAPSPSSSAPAPAPAGGTVHGCPYGDVCVYPEGKGWNNDVPSIEYYTYGYHNLVNQLNYHYVLNNQWGSATASFCTGYGGGGTCSPTLAMGTSTNINLTPINSITLTA